MSLAPPGSFGRSVLTLATGTVAAQALSLLSAPVLSRLYTPTDFGTFALYNSWLALGAAWATAKFENAVMLPAEDDKGWALVLLSGGVAVAVTLLLALGLAVAAVLRVVNSAPPMPGWVWVLPLGVFASSFGTVLSLWLTRRREYRQIAANRVVLVAVMVAIHITLGLRGLGALGLFLGYLAGEVIRIGMLLRATVRSRPPSLGASWRLAVAAMWRRYRRFAGMSLAADSVNSLTSQMPAQLLQRAFGLPVLGQYSQSERMAGLPARVLGSAIADVFRQRASADFAQNGNCRAIWVRTLGWLVMLASLPTLALLFFGPELFHFVLGSQWEQAGEISRLLAVLFFFRFVSGPLSHVIYIAERQSFDVVWQVALAIAVFGALSAGILTGSVSSAVLSYALTYSAFYVVYLGYGYRCACGVRRL